MGYNKYQSIFLFVPECNGHSNRERFAAVGLSSVLKALVARLSICPWGLLQALPPLPLPAPIRQAAVHALQAAVQVS